MRQSFGMCDCILSNTLSDCVVKGPLKGGLLFVTYERRYYQGYIPQKAREISQFVLAVTSVLGEELLAFRAGARLFCEGSI
jgi:hypothetical protein